MTPLEARYRLLLRAYPRAFRERHGEEMVSTLLDVTGDRNRPPVTTALSMVVHGVGYRVRAVPDGRAAAVVAGEVGLLLAVLAAVGTPLLGAWIGSGYVAGSVTGCVLWGVLVALLIATRLCSRTLRLAATVVVVVLGAIAYSGGAEVMGRCGRSSWRSSSPRPSRWSRHDRPERGR